MCQRRPTIAWFNRWLVILLGLVFIVFGICLYFFITMGIPGMLIGAIVSAALAVVSAFILAGINCGCSATADDQADELMIMDTAAANNDGISVAL